MENTQTITPEQAIVNNLAGKIAEKEAKIAILEVNLQIVNQASQEKDSIIESLQKELKEVSELLNNQKSVLETLSGKKDTAPEADTEK